MKKLSLLILIPLMSVVTPLDSCKELLKSYLSFNISESFLSNNDVIADDVVVNDDKNTTTDTDEQHPTISFENPKFNFGNVYKGKKVEHIFKFENLGKSNLEIKKVKTSCGCTAAILSNKVIPPGEQGEIKATFNSGSYRGKVTKSITVNSNDPKNPSYKLTISGKIIEIISVNPKRVNFGPVNIGGEMERIITVTSESDPEFKIEKVTSTKTFVSALIDDKEDGNEHIIKLTLKDNKQIGRFSGAIHLETDNSKQQKVKIPFFGETVGDITTYPKKIFYGKIMKGVEKTQKLFVKINKDGIEITDIKISPDYLSAKIVEDNKKKDIKNTQHLIEIKLSKDATVGKLNGTLEVNTTSQIQPVIKIPITGEIGPLFGIKTQ